MGDDFGTRQFQFPGSRVGLSKQGPFDADVNLLGAGTDTRTATAKLTLGFCKRFGIENRDRFAIFVDGFLFGIRQGEEGRDGEILLGLLHLCCTVAWSRFHSFQRKWSMN